MDRMNNDFSSFMFIPMLTKNRPQKNKDITGRNNPGLWALFNNLFGDGAAEGYFEGIRHYFASGGFKTIVFIRLFFPIQVAGNISILFVRSCR
jgi:hypothetical protein